MNINKAELLVENEVFNKLRQIENQERNFKVSVQPLGGDIVEYTATNLSLVTMTLNAGGNGRITGIITPAVAKVVNWDVLVGLFIDVDFDVNYLYPIGPSINALRFKFPIKVWWDWAQSDDDTGVRVYHIDFINKDTVSHTLYFYLKTYGPKLAVA